MTIAALLAVVGRPSWWLLALAAFLVRGGILLFLLVVVSLPSLLVVSNVVVPLVQPLALGSVDVETVAPIALLALAGLGWLVGGSWIAAVIEIALIRAARAAAIEDGLPVGPRLASGRWLSGRVAAAHLVAHVPLAVAIGVGSVQIGNVAYAELTHPFEIATPLVIRVAAGAIAPLAAIVIAWLAGEIVGALAARRIVLGGASVAGSLLGALGDVARRPASTLLPALGIIVILALDLAAMLGAVAVVWTAARARLVDPSAEGWTVVVTLLALGGAWAASLALTGLVDAWRGAAATIDMERAAAARAIRAGRDPDHGGTFGASAGRHPVDWPIRDEGGSL